MAGEQDDQLELDAPNQDDAQGDADFEAAFNSARGNAHAEGPTDKKDDNALVIDQNMREVPGADDGGEANAEADAAAQAEAAAAAAAAEEDAPVQVSRKDFNRLMQLADQLPVLQEELRTTKDKTFGKLGSLQQMVDGFKAQAAKGGPAFSVKQLARLEAEFPELASLLVQDLGDAFGSSAAPTQPAGDEGNPDAGASGAAAPGADAAQVDPFNDPRVQERLQQQEAQTRQLHMAVVDQAHPDWRDLARTPEFAEWRTSLPAQAQQLLAGSWDSSVMTDAFTDFKNWRAKRSATADASNQRDKRLANAVPATTGRPTGQHVVDDDAAFLSGFKKARGG